MPATDDPKRPHPPALPEQAEDVRRRNRPIGPSGDDDHPIDEPPEEHARRNDDPHGRDKL